MEKPSLNKIYWGVIVFLLIIFASGCTKQEKPSNILLLPNLPYPIAKEPALVTVAGQGQEGLIVAKMCDKLKIDNDYRYKADLEDLSDIGCLIVVEGISMEGLKASFTNLQEDELRLDRLLNKVRELKIPVICVIPGGSLRSTKKDYLLAEKIIARSQYLIALKAGDKDAQLSGLAKKYNCKLSLMQTMQDIPVPLNSVFR